MRRATQAGLLSFSRPSLPNTTIALEEMIEGLAHCT
jgi:hypothetical protein